MKPLKETSLKIEQDYRIFFAFMTIILVGMYFVSIKSNPALQQFWNGALFTLLMVTHIALHWLVVRIIQTPKRKALYIIGQGLLALIITCPGAITRYTNAGTCATIVTYPDPTYSDNCPNATLSLESGPASGTSLAAGTYQAIWKVAQDGGALMANSCVE